jgi:dehydrogenase/reductase SDR family protein 12
LTNDKRFTSDGTEATISSHLIGGSYLLSKLLLPNLKNASSTSTSSTSSTSTSSTSSTSRVIYVSSGGMLTTKFPKWDEATNTAPNQKYDGVMAYAYAKRGQILLAEQFAKLHPEVKFVSCHPGWVDTIGVEEAFGSQKKLFSPLRSKWEGAEGIAWLMSTDGDNLKSGGFYLDRKVQPKHISGCFMTEGSFTKNSDEEIHEFMEKLEVVGM